MVNPRDPSIRRSVVSVRRALTALDGALERLTAALDGAGSPPKGSKRRARTLSPRARAAMKLQGRYMGFMRRLSPRQKAEVRAVRENNGIRAAIRKAKQLAGA